MAEQDNKEKTPNTMQELAEDSFKKSFSKQIQDQTSERLQQGQSPQEILSQLLQTIGGEQSSPQDVIGQLQKIQSQPIPTGQKAGLIPSLLQTGKLGRIPQTTNLGFDEAVKVLQLQQQQQQGQRQLPQQQADLLKSVLELSEKVGRLQTEGEQIERDISGQLTSKGIEQTQEAQVRAKKEAEDVVKKEQLKKDLDVYFDIADLIPTGEGVGRFKTGVGNFIQSIKQDTPRGVAADRLKSMNKRLRVTLVRAAGDVGNLNIVEQKAAEELLFKFDDATQTRALKRAVLEDLSRAIKDKNEQATKNLINTWMQTEDFKSEFKDDDAGQIMTDAQGNKARVFRDGRVIEEGQDGF
jgi:hypothetical protein